MTQSSFGTEKLGTGSCVSEEKLMMLVLEEETDSRRDVLRQRRGNDKHYVYDRVFAEESTQVQRELVQTPMHLSQYRVVINELREEIARLKVKMKDDRTSKPNEDSQGALEILSPVDSEQNATHLKTLREAIVSTFKQQMRLRRRLMELDSHLLGLALDAERQHAAISHWEARGVTGMAVSGSTERAEAEVAVEQAWSELAAVEREQEAARLERDRVERHLEQVRLRGAQLEKPSKFYNIEAIL
ncbi:unnamed protein product [Leptidea sinapis]|uniref:Uncharacterized protein n=1 Tax=Leptidea sinapis TaxID=189913 RepID=A0A5E4Q9N3_9NEOP|nr:unnamed protein product [Leptidea sinapis]